MGLRRGLQPCLSLRICGQARLTPTPFGFSPQPLRTRGNPSPKVVDLGPNTDATRDALAKGIVTAATLGERDQRKLRDAALAFSRRREPAEGRAVARECLLRHLKLAEGRSPPQIAGRITTMTLWR